MARLTRLLSLKRLTWLLGTLGVRPVYPPDRGPCPPGPVNSYAINTGGFQGVRLEDIRAISGLSGYWPADPAYIYQDSAGYIPASVGGVVGQVRDISNAATPVARRNLLTYSEEFDNAAWMKTEITVTQNSATASDGTNSADLIVASIINAGHDVYQTLTATANTTYTSSCDIKTSGLRYAYVTVNQRNSGVFVGFVGYVLDLQTGTLSSVIVAGTTPPTSPSVAVISKGGGWFRLSVSATTAATGVNQVRQNIGITNSASAIQNFTGDGTSGIYIWGAQLELGGEATPYQKIVTGTGDTFLPGNHAYQQTTANKPILRTVTSPNGYWCDGDADDALNVTLPSDLGSSCTVVRATAAGVTFTEGQTITSPYNLLNPYDADDFTRYSADVAIFNRALTATEKNLVTQYFARGVPTLTNGVLV